ncbi:MAG: hypothetical protein ACI31S_02715 [Bacilli bacterium]
MNNQNYNGQPMMNNQPMNNQGYNQQPMMNNQSMNNQGYNQPTKKKNTALIVGLSIVGVFILGIVALFVTFYIEEKQDKPWKSGQVQILGKNIQLPCDVDTFESTLNSKIIDSEFSDVIKDVEIQINYRTTLKFDVYVENDLVIGIMIEAKESYPGDYYFLNDDANDRNIATNIVYPGNVTVETPIDKVNELYSTKPFNGSYVYWDEEIGTEPPYKISALHEYRNSEWSIEFHTLDGEVTGIDYFYLKH